MNTTAGISVINITAVRVWRKPSFLYDNRYFVFAAAFKVLEKHRRKSGIR